MENKLQQLTQKLYDEGLEKGRAEADKLVADAKAEARKIVAEARAEAEEIVKKAEAKAEDVSKNTMTEISLAGKQAVGRIKSEIASLIIAKATARGVKEAVVDPAFIKEMLVAVAKNWNGSDSGKVELQALLPEGERKKLDAAFEESAKELLAAGVEVGWSKEVKTGFKVGAKEGGYYISFADADIEALLAEAAARFGLAFEQGADCAAVARQGGADPALFLFRKLGELSGFAAEVCVPVYGSAPGIVDRFGQKRSRVRHAVRGEKVPVPFEQGAQLIVAVGGQHALEGQGAHVVASAGGEKNAHRIPPRPGAFPALRGALAVMDHTRSWFCRQTAFHGPHTEKNAGIR